jgi:hypothetical protein
MLSIAECRQILGATAESLSDEEVLNIRDSLRELAEIGFETKIKLPKLSALAEPRLTKHKQ